MKNEEIIEMVEKLNKEIWERPCGDSYATNYKGERITLDTGYAVEGIDFFIEELKHKLGVDS